MYLGQEYNVIGEWFKIHFTENAGMAFGLQLGGSYGKLFLSVFRIIAVGFIAYYLFNLVKKNSPFGLIFSIALIFAGAVGNILDSIFYGKIFSESYNEIAQFMPANGGYDGWLHGKVVDMFYFPLVEGVLPDWIPFLGGDYFVFFQPVFNLADSSITAGVLLIILFQRNFFGEKKQENIIEENSSNQPMNS